LVILFFACDTVDDPTRPKVPIATPSTDIVNKYFAANWNSVPGITKYLLYLSLDNFPADPLNNLLGYDDKEVTGISYNVTGLNSGTIYYCVVKAKSINRTSCILNSIIVKTNN
jgi:hypothetical protein